MLAWVLSSASRASYSPQSICPCPSSVCRSSTTRSPSPPSIRSCTSLIPRWHGWAWHRVHLDPRRPCACLARLPLVPLPGQPLSSLIELSSHSNQLSESLSSTAVHCQHWSSLWASCSPPALACWPSRAPRPFHRCCRWSWLCLPTRSAAPRSSPSSSWWSSPGPWSCPAAPESSCCCRRPSTPPPCLSLPTPLAFYRILWLCGPHSSNLNLIDA